MNALAEKMLDDFEELPEEMQIEAINFVHFLKEKMQHKKSYQGKKIREILEKGCEQGIFSEINNPVEWQQEIRKDRSLPNRE